MAGRLCLCTAQPISSKEFVQRLPVAVRYQRGFVGVSSDCFKSINKDFFLFQSACTETISATECACESSWSLLSPANPPPADSSSPQHGASFPSLLRDSSVCRPPKNRLNKRHSIVPRYGQHVAKYNDSLGYKQLNSYPNKCIWWYNTATNFPTVSFLLLIQYSNRKTCGTELLTC